MGGTIDPLDAIVEVAKRDPDAKRRFEVAVGVGKAAKERLEAAGYGPRTRDELHAAIKELTGYHIPRVAVCQDHVAPFTTFADLYFGQTEDGDPVTDVLWIGNRGGGKTTNSGFLHGAKCRWNPDYESVVAGAMRQQGVRAYAEFQRFIRHIEEEIVDSLKGETEFINGSKFAIVSGTIKGVNGPHPQLAQFDEAELTDNDVFEEFLNMSQGNTQYPGQNLLTSTRKWPYGIVQSIVTEEEQRVAMEAADADDEDFVPGEQSWRIDIFCLFESLQNVPNCMNGCGCDRIKKGVWGEGPKAGQARTFQDYCQGKAKNADGHMRLRDAWRRFRTLSRRTFEAQQMCWRPSREGLVHDWLEDRHVIPDWYPRAEYGAIYLSWDFGTTNPSSVHFSQLLNVDLEVQFDDEQEKRRFPEGALITFDEIYGSGKSATVLAREVMDRIELWQKYGFGMDIAHAFRDPAAAMAKKDVDLAFLEAGWEQLNWRAVPARIEDSVEKHIEWGDDQRLYIVGPRCEMLLWEYDRYHWPDRREGQPPPKHPVKVDDHAMDDQRYMIWNLYKLSLGQETDIPVGEFQKTAESRSAREEKRENKSHKRRAPGNPPGGSTASPDYTRRQPSGLDVPTIRREKIGTVRR